MEAILALQHGQCSRVVFLSPRLIALATFRGVKGGRRCVSGEQRRG